ncbi:MAG: hypothetical protein COV41_01275 [Candidatus Brennerbacteria bacterium CG11_big_fil_rev_8_21_14_0_20_43_10]|uniref:Ribonuclease P protein component n=3 Tax=Candidatus Brenneribacteriota TaxID=1817902 RepID=A0A2M8C2U6_9BACT|nr:MAG: hypothetical protein AUJ43_00100 [Parcubacteria group bacterium CG1_02_44_31]PIP50283.1 MAG: hypothetical protein COX12_02155 [Candidatus Brennerbacteria bacterium CG23_combo_of_CG06-09_8_20_14_all_44_41]PIR26521.1 MAG: hypothetical protein COV41_01275 [Candidatus Brennerbacteria bacterium CG11_big_fil_rev_8_21_14_0_20_43_10]PIX29035.1 MAG: hypothetical protein COZ64_01180 [Candidatus Brennerbacteria bacterium CG_4_8_14_3_um_filter_43_14]PJA19675.1 MAG: hypothetical protein COX61_00555 
MLPKAHRIAAHNDFEIIMRRGNTLDNGYVRFFWMPNALAKNRFGFLIKTRVFRHAVQRNQWKRVVRDLVQPFLNPKTSNTGYDCAMLLYKFPNIASTRTAWQQPICDLLARAGIINHV